MPSYAVPYVRERNELPLVGTLVEQLCAPLVRLMRGLFAVPLPASSGLRPHFGFARHAAGRARAESEAAAKKKPCDQVADRREMPVGHSRWACEVRERTATIAPYHSNVLITGPSGTGKELIARRVHRLSGRAERVFIPVDCAAIGGELFASQLFGHVKGAFTGADHPALGAFRAAEGGTLFLDEIGELDAGLQAKLLRVLQERVVVPVGSHEGIPVDVRLVAATNRDLVEEVRRGRFRLDLYYRLAVLKVETAPLSARLEDIEPIAAQFLARLSLEHGVPGKQLAREALAVLEAYDWPGNVRELLNTLERAFVFTPGRVIGAEAIDLPCASSRDVSPLVEAETLGREAEHPVTGSRGVSSSAWPALADIERQHIRQTLEHTRHNRSATARLLGVDRRRLIRLLRKYGLTRSTVACQQSDR